MSHVAVFTLLLQPFGWLPQSVCSAGRPSFWRVSKRNHPAPLLILFYPDWLSPPIPNPALPVGPIFCWSSSSEPNCLATDAVSPMAAVGDKTYNMVLHIVVMEIFPGILTLGFSECFKVLIWPGGTDTPLLHSVAPLCPLPGSFLLCS